MPQQTSDEQNYSWTLAHFEKTLVPTHNQEEFSCARLRPRPNTQSRKGLSSVVPFSLHIVVVKNSTTQYFQYFDICILTRFILLLLFDNKYEITSK